jgi:peptidoglycan-N-acetylglucosamine deacetylase
MSHDKSDPSLCDEWPDDASVAVAFTFDFDADVERSWRDFDRRLTSISELRFGAVRGVFRILESLAREGIRATFYVPGKIAEAYPRAVLEIVAAGHEIGHHGYAHLFNDRASLQQQRDELTRGTEALEDLLGKRPGGYRAPGWELTPESLDMLIEMGFDYDSSCMGDDRPYFETSGDRRMLELPVHWSLDDWVYYGFQRDELGHMADPEVVRRVWLSEFDSATRERRLVTYTLHPECSGRGYRALMLEELFGAMRERASVWFATHGEIASWLTARHNPAPDVSPGHD